MPSKSSSLPEGETPPTENPTLCHTGPIRVAPSTSPFVIKLETYLRMTEIPYNVDIAPNKYSSKGKIPFLRHNGKEIVDTAFIISYLNKTYEKDLNANLNDLDQSVSRAFLKMAEENTYWTLIHYRFIESNSILTKQIPLTGMRKNIWTLYYKAQMKPNHKANLNGHGMGRHTKEEIHDILDSDLKAFSTFLGEKSFFMGDEPTEIDAFLFALFACFCYTIPDSPHEKMCKETYPNIFAYTERMREKYWADWDEMCFHEKKKEEEPAETEAAKEGEEKADAEAADNTEAAGDATKKEEEKNGKTEENGKESNQEESKEDSKEEPVESKPSDTNGDGDAPEK